MQSSTPAKCTEPARSSASILRVWILLLQFEWQSVSAIPDTRQLIRLCSVDQKVFSHSLQNFEITIDLVWSKFYLYSRMLTLNNFKLSTGLMPSLLLQARFGLRLLQPFTASFRLQATRDVVIHFDKVRLQMEVFKVILIWMLAGPITTNRWILFGFKIKFRLFNNVKLLFQLKDVIFFKSLFPIESSSLC